MQYSTDFKKVYFHFSEDGVRHVFLNFFACYFPLYQPHRKLLSPEQSIFDDETVIFKTFENVDLL